MSERIRFALGCLVRAAESFRGAPPSRFDLEAAAVPAREGTPTMRAALVG